MKIVKVISVFICMLPTLSLGAGKNCGLIALFNTCFKCCLQPQVKPERDRSGSIATTHQGSPQSHNSEPFARLSDESDNEESRKKSSPLAADSTRVNSNRRGSPLDILNAPQMPTRRLEAHEIVEELVNQVNVASLVAINNGMPLSAPSALLGSQLRSDEMEPSQVIVASPSPPRDNGLLAHESSFTYTSDDDEVTATLEAEQGASAENGAGDSEADEGVRPRRKKKCRPQYFTFTVDHILRSAMRDRDRQRKPHLRRTSDASTNLAAQEWANDVHFKLPSNRAAHTDSNE